jgi:hypothetical protein
MPSFMALRHACVTQAKARAPRIKDDLGSGFFQPAGHITASALLCWEQLQHPPPNCQLGGG